MASVVKEYICPSHGYFESPLPVCPTCGATDVKRTFTGPPSFKSDKTKRTDSDLRDLTQSYGMGDYSNNESTKHTKDTSNTWADMGDQAALSQLGISVRNPSEEERKMPTVLRKAPITNMVSNLGAFEAVGHKEDK